MKIRSGFVSNSSSASFSILKSKLKDWQLWAIRDHTEFALHVLGWGLESAYYESWGIEETPSIIEGSTSMDNFGMQVFLDQIDVGYDDIDYGDSGGWGDTGHNKYYPKGPTITELWRDKKAEMLDFKGEIDDVELEFVDALAYDGDVLTKNIQEPGKECVFLFKITRGPKEAYRETHVQIITDGVKWVMVSEYTEFLDRVFKPIFMDPKLKLHREVMANMGPKAFAQTQDGIRQYFGN